MSATVEKIAGSADASMDCLVRLSDGLDQAFQSAARAAVAGLLADRSLAPALETPAAGYSRALIFRDPLGRFSLWMFSWAPGSVTPVHDHHCLCVYGVYQGRLEERLFAVDGADIATEIHRACREAGYLSGPAAASGEAHQIVNPGAQAAHSIHLYAFDPARHADSLGRRYESPGWTS
jgi:predicted metal-dependent enzyme (double-stranded beta helix superfamily)